MNKETIKAFLAWLEAASEAEIDERQKEILATAKRVQTREGRSDFNLALRLIDEEILARMELQKLKTKA